MCKKIDFIMAVKAARSWIKIDVPCTTENKNGYIYLDEEYYNDYYNNPESESLYTFNFSVMTFITGKVEIDYCNELE